MSSSSLSPLSIFIPSSFAPTPRSDGAFFSHPPMISLIAAQMEMMNRMMNQLMKSTLKMFMSRHTVCLLLPIRHASLAARKWNSGESPILIELKSCSSIRFIFQRGREYVNNIGNQLTSQIRSKENGLFSRQKMLSFYIEHCRRPLYLINRKISSEVH